MIIRMHELVSKGITVPFHTTLNVDELLKNNKDVLKAEPLAIRLEAKAEGPTVIVQGEVSAKIELACSRCLDPVREQLVIPFLERFQSASAPVDGELDEDILVVSEDKVDLTPYVEDALLLHIPFVPLCGDSCKGLCATCGTNLNETACGCDNEKIDPRLAALKDLFKS